MGTSVAFSIEGSTLRSLGEGGIKKFSPAEFLEVLRGRI
jgi:hypothetical protein